MDRDAMIGLQLGGRYELTGELGRGGMGVVYRARDPVLEREVAVKMIARDGLGDAGSEERHEERFRREALLVAKLEHPSIVPVFDFGRHDRWLFFVMPLLSGRTLAELVKDRVLTLGEVLEIICQAADALDHSAAHGVIHRDVKPENLMVSRADGHALRVRVMDFGLAFQPEGHRLTKPEQLPGTPAYLSPEYVLSLDLDGRSDLYSLAVVLHECLAGAPPFAGGQSSILYQVVNERPMPLQELGVDSELAYLVDSCLAKDPGDRPARSADFAAALREIAGSLGERSAIRVPLENPAGAARGTGRRRALAAPPFVGRGPELAEILERARLAVQGNCQVVLIAGEAGSGKTRLLEQVERRLSARGFRALHGYFPDAESTFPHHGFCELILDYFRQLAQAGSDRPGRAPSRISVNPGPGPDFEDLAPDLLKLFPALSALPAFQGEGAGTVRTEQGSGAPAGRGADRTWVFELLAQALTRLVAGAPTVLMLEGLHKAEASIDALEYVVRRLAATPALVVATYRSDETPRRHPLTRLVRGLRGDPAFRLLELRAWDAVEVGALVSAWTARRLTRPEDADLEALARQLFEAADGHPLFTCELLRSVLESGTWGREREDPRGSSSGTSSGDTKHHLTILEIDELPATIQQAVEGRLERLPERLREILEIASVLGRSFDLHDLLALAGGEADVEDAVERLFEEGILEEGRKGRSGPRQAAPGRAATGQEIRFASGPVRDVLYGQLTRRRRKRLHRRHAEELERRYEGRLERIYPRLVEHFSHADVALKTVTYALMLARSSAGASAPAETLRAARTALEFVEDYELDTSGEVEGELRTLLAEALRFSGNVEGALKEAGKAVAALEHGGELAAAAQAALLASETSWHVRKTRETRLWLARGIELARRSSATRPLRQLLTFAATVSNLRGEHREARSLLREVDELEAAERNAAETPSPVAVGGTLRSVLPVPITTCDPALSWTVEDAEVLGCIFEPLLTTDGEGNLTPRLATEWIALDGGCRWQLGIRKGVVFADGAPLDAAAVKDSFESSIRRAGDAGDPGALALGFRSLAGVDAFLAGEAEHVEGIKVLGRRSLELRLVGALPFFPVLLSDLRTAVTHENPESSPRWLGTGPFRWREPSLAGPVLEPNPRGHGTPPPAIRRLEFRVVDGPSAAVRGLLDGRLDLVHGLPPAELDAVLREPVFRDGLVKAPRKSVYFVLFNRFGEHTRKDELRHALAGTIRVHDVVWRTLGRFAEPADGLIPPGILGHQIGRRRDPLPREEAVDLLRAAGFDLPIRLRAAVHPLFSSYYTSFLEALRDAWRAIGCEIEIGSPSLDAYLESWRQPADLLIGRWLPDYHDPDGLTCALFHSRHGIFRRYCSARELDDLLERGQEARDANRRRRLYRRVERWLADEQALLPLFHEIDYRLAGPLVRRLHHLPGPPYVDYARLVKVRGEQRPFRAEFSAAGALRIPLTTTFERLEPSTALYVEPADVVPNVFETLMTVDKGARIAPHLAERYQTENDGRALRIELRSGVRFHDGQRLGSRDVRFSFERLLKAPYPGVEAALLPIRGARAFRAGQTDRLTGLHLVSERELVLELEEPLSFFPAMLTSPTTAIFPEGTGDFSSNWRQGCSGTGPFRLVRCRPGERIDLEANPSYWRGAPRSQGLIFELGVPAERIAAEFRSGHFAIASKLPAPEIDALRQDERFATGFLEAPGFTTYFLVLNSRRPPFADRDLRLALKHALDAEGLVRETLGPMAVPATGLICPGLLGHEPAEEGTRAEGSGSLPSLGPLDVSLHPIYSSQYRSVWDACSRTLTGLGAELRVAHRSMPEILQELRGGDVDLAVARRIAAYPDTDALVSVLHSREGLLGQLVDHPEIDRLIEKARLVEEPGLRHALYRELEEILAREALLIPFFDEQIYCFARPEVRGLRLRLAWPRIAYEELRMT